MDEPSCRFSIKRCHWRCFSFSSHSTYLFFLILVVYFLRLADFNCSSPLHVRSLFYPLIHAQHRVTLFTSICLHDLPFFFTPLFLELTENTKVCFFWLVFNQLTRASSVGWGCENEYSCCWSLSLAVDCLFVRGGGENGWFQGTTSLYHGIWDAHRVDWWAAKIFNSYFCTLYSLLEWQHCFFDRDLEKERGVARQ